MVVWEGEHSNVFGFVFSCSSDQNGAVILSKIMIHIYVKCLVACVNKFAD